MFSRKLSLSMILAALLAGAPMSTALADPPPWAPAHGYRAKHHHHHHYVYYPAYEVYYEPARSLWFWLGDGGWHFGASLPAYYPRSHFHSGVTLFLDTPRPYERHVHVIEKHGGKKHHRKRRR